MLLIWLLLLAPLAEMSGAESKPAKPNIVLIFVDDLGYGDLGCYGGKLVPTPAIDSLARDGVRFTDGYVTAPVCAPSRCGLMTGAYNQRFGMQGNADRARYGIGPHQLMPGALKAAGYSTGHIGKWNIGSDIAGWFDETYDVVDWEADYFAKPDGTYRGVDDPVHSDSGKIQGVWGTSPPGTEYLTDRMGRHAVEFIDKHKAGPFFLYLAFNAVHSPLQAKAADRERFAHIKPEPLNYYAAMLASLDENVGRVLTKLKAAGLEENTIVIFVSDNGPAAGAPKIWQDGWPKNLMLGSAGPLNGSKGGFFEGGIRVPFIVRWPAQLKRGITFSQPVSTMDFYPTLCAVAGAPVPPGTKLDGVNVMPYLRGDRTGAPHDTLFWKSGERGAVRAGDWKLVLGALNPQLYNLASDIGEQHDLSATQPALVEKLRQEWLKWSAALPPTAGPESARARRDSPKAKPALQEPVQNVQR
jgi:arylsulfatase A-like enzyme